MTSEDLTNLIDLAIAEADLNKKLYENGIITFSEIMASIPWYAPTENWGRQ